MAPVEKVSLLALVYKVMYRDHYGGAVSLEDELESYPDGISPIGLIGSQMLQPEDWLLVETMGEQGRMPVGLLRDVAAADPLRVEAFLHAWPKDPQRELAGEEWARPYVKRWPLVEAMMTALDPVTWTRETQEDIARAVG